MPLGHYRNPWKLSGTRQPDCEAVHLWDIFVYQQQRKNHNPDKASVTANLNKVITKGVHKCFSKYVKPNHI